MAQFIAQAFQRMRIGAWVAAWRRPLCAAALAPCALLFGFQPAAASVVSGPVLAAASSPPGALLFPGFDVSLGTLESVTLDLSSSATFPVRLVAMYSGHHQLSFTTAYSLGTPGGSGSTAGQASDSVLFTGSDWMGDLPMTPLTLVESDPAFLAAVSQAGDVTLLASVVQCWRLDGMSSSTCSAPSTDVAATVRYTYLPSAVPVPEPGGAALVLLALAACQAAGRRLRAQRGTAAR